MRVPSMLRILCLIWLCQVALSISMISRPEKGLIAPQINEADCKESLTSENKTYELTSLSAAFKSKKFTQYFLMMFFGILFQGFFAYVYKPIGLASGLHDNLLAWAGSSAAVVQAVSRVGFGFAYDKVGFKKIFKCLMIINIVTALACYAARS